MQQPTLFEAISPSPSLSSIADCLDEYSSYQEAESVLEEFLGEELAKPASLDIAAAIPPQTHSKFAYSSAMQKSLRRGYFDDAVKYALAYHAIDPTGFWTRLVVVALEDVGMGNPVGVALTMAAARSKVLRKKIGGDQQIIPYIVRLLAESVKDRSCCDFMQVLWHNHRKHRDITTLRTASFQELSEFVLTEKLPTSFRACAAWLLAGTDRYENKQLPLRSGSREIFNATIERMNVPALSRYIATRSTVACRYPMGLLLPFMWQMQSKSLYVSIEKTDFPDKREYIAGLPSETWDQYTREGKQSLAYFGKACEPVDDWLTRKGITSNDARMAAIGAAVFIGEGAKLNRRLLFEGVDEITEAVELIDYRNVGLALNDGRELAAMIEANTDILREARVRVVGGYRS